MQIHTTSLPRLPPVFLNRSLVTCVLSCMCSYRTVVKRIEQCRVRVWELMNDVRPFAKGSVESTHKVPKGTDQPLPHETHEDRRALSPRSRLGRAARWTNSSNTPARIFKDPAPTPRPSHTTSIGPHAGSSYNWPPRAPEQLHVQVRPVPRARPLGNMKSTLDMT